MGSVFLDGNEAVARAAILAGCDFFAGYPITPATSIFHHMLDFLPPQGSICMQGEDEIASIGLCLGAAVGGAKVMTATSGPGISLFSEQISFAIGAEIPIVIVDVQRLGPSTGSATKGADGDIQFLRWGNSGGLPVIVLAPVDVKDAFVLTLRAFYFAQKYRCPVFIASNKEVGMVRESVDVEVLSRLEDKSCNCESEMLKMNNMARFGTQELVRLTSSTHGADNYITTDPQVIEDALLRMEQKLLSASGELCCMEVDANPDDSILLVTYGVTARAAAEALLTLRQKGCAVSLLVIKTLFPVAERELKSVMKGKEKIIVVEMNLGQYVREIERLAGGIPVHFFGQMNGELITPASIVREVLS
jgi:2-oxoglutarate ferredoxin oxidoreductase subunit alpha